jgi:hypothetical protein
MPINRLLQDGKISPAEVEMKWTPELGPGIGEVKV